MMPSSLSMNWALYPNSTGLSMRPLRIGRASGSCRLTSRVALSGICPASRSGSWGTIVAVRSRVTASSASARRSRPRIRPRRARRWRGGRRAVPWQPGPPSSRPGPPAPRSPGRSPPTAPHRLASPGSAACWRPGGPAGQQHAAGPSSPCRAPPAACTRRAARTSLPTALASSPQSVG